MAALNSHNVQIQLTTRLFSGSSKCETTDGVDDATYTGSSRKVKKAKGKQRRGEERRGLFPVNYFYTSSVCVQSGNSRAVPCLWPNVWFDPQESGETGIKGSRGVDITFCKPHSPVAASVTQVPHLPLESRYVYVYSRR